MRIIRCWLLLVERGLALHTGLASHPSDGYKLAADWAQNYDSRLVNGLVRQSDPSQVEIAQRREYCVSVKILAIESKYYFPI